MSKNDVFQPWRKFQPDTDGSPHLWVQFKGTDLCADFHCACGYHGHLDVDFAYTVGCPECGRVYECSGHVELHDITGNLGEHKIKNVKVAS